MKSHTFTLTVEYDPEATEPGAVADALDGLLEGALSTQGILDEVGDPTVRMLDDGLNELLRHPDIDDAEHILRTVYEHMGLPVPSFMDD